MPNVRPASPEAPPDRVPGTRRQRSRRSHATTSLLIPAVVGASMIAIPTAAAAAAPIGQTTSTCSASGLASHLVADGDTWSGIAQGAQVSMRSLFETNGTYYYYGHLADFAPELSVGSRVQAGQIVGFMGNTGNSAFPHLHFEIHPNGGSAVNPHPVLRQSGGCKTGDQYRQPGGWVPD